MTIVSIEGPVGSGKSSIVASIPYKMLYMDCEHGFDRAFVPEGNLENIEVWRPEQSIPANALDLLMETELTTSSRVVSTGKRDYWQHVMKRYVEFLKDKKTKVGVIDPWKFIWERNREGHLEATSAESISNGKKARENLIQIEYVVPNNRQQAIMDLANQRGKHLILVSHQRPKYVESFDPSEGVVKRVPSGEMEIDGFSHTYRTVDWAFETQLEENCPLQGKKVGNKEHTCLGFHFNLKIKKAANTQALKGRVIKDANFNTIEQYLNRMGTTLLK